MPFGKYKGTPIADLPGNYLNWFAREGFPKGEIGRLLALMHEIDHLACRRCSIRCANAEAVMRPHRHGVASKRKASKDFLLGSETPKVLVHTHKPVLVFH